METSDVCIYLWVVGWTTQLGPDWQPCTGLEVNDMLEVTHACSAHHDQCQEPN